LTLALLLQRLRPHARLRVAGKWNGGIWFTNLIVIGVVCGACACTVARWAAKRGIGVLNTMPAPGGWIPAAIVTLDLVSYLWHRANTASRSCGAFHQVHHSDPTFTASTGVRFHPGELLLSLPVRLTAVAWLARRRSGRTFEIAFTVANLVEHGDIDLPLRFERLIGARPRHPGAPSPAPHEARPRPGHELRNLPGDLDRLFGTRADNDSATAIETGLPGMDELTLPRVFVLPLQRMAE